MHIDLEQFAATALAIRPTDALIAKLCFGWQEISPNHQWNYSESRSVWREIDGMHRWNGFPPGVSPRDPRRVPAYTVGLHESMELVERIGMMGFQIKVHFPHRGNPLFHAISRTTGESASAETQPLAISRLALIIMARMRPENMKEDIDRLGTLSKRAAWLDQRDVGRYELWQEFEPPYMEPLRIDIERLRA